MSRIRNESTTPLLAGIGLIAVTAVWGSTFFLIKDLLEEVSAMDFLSVRFTLAALAAALVLRGRLRDASRATWRRGSTLGAIYCGGQVFQTVGLRSTDASVSGFITGMYVVLTPVLLYVFFKERVARRTWGAVLIATVGLMILSLNGFAIGGGEALTFVGSALYALHIVVLSRWARRDDPLTLGTMQLISVAVIATAGALPNGISLPQSPSTWVSMLYMTFFAALGAMLVQSWSQARLSAPTAAIIMITEPVFASAFAIAFGGEHLTGRLLIGGFLMLAAMFLTELGEGLRPRRRSKSQPACAT